MRSRMVVRRRKTRKGKGRRTTRRRKQKGGGVLELFVYNVDKGKGEIIVSEKIVSEDSHVTEDTIKRLTISYKIIGEGKKRIAYLASIARPKDDESSVYFPKIGYLGVKKLMEVLEDEGVEYIYLMVAPRTEEFYKLYRYYRSIGFYCLPFTFYDNDEPEEKNVEEIFTIRKGELNFLERTKPLINILKNMSKSEKGKLRNRYTNNCGKMIGKVSEIKQNLEEKIYDIAARMFEAFPNL